MRMLLIYSSGKSQVHVNTECIGKIFRQHIIHRVSNPAVQHPFVVTPALLTFFIVLFRQKKLLSFRKDPLYELISVLYFHTFILSYFCYYDDLSRLRFIDLSKLMPTLIADTIITNYISLLLSMKWRVLMMRLATCLPTLVADFSQSACLRG